MSEEQGLRYLIVDVVSLQNSHKIICCTTFIGLEGQKKKGDMELDRGLVSGVWAGGAWHSAGGSVCKWKADMVVVMVVKVVVVVEVERGLMSCVWAGMVVVVGVSGWEVAHSVSRRPAGHSEESNYSLMDPTATAPAPGPTNVCLFSPQHSNQIHCNSPPQV